MFSRTDLSVLSQRNHRLYGGDLFNSRDFLTYREKEFLHYQIKPIIITLRIMGSFPVQLKLSGVPSFKWLSPAMVYSVIFILLIGSITCINLRDHYIQIQQNENFSEAMYHVLFITLLSIPVAIPFLSWFQMKKAVQYIKKWIQFQVMFLKVTRSYTHLNYRKFAVLMAILNILLILTVCIFHYNYPYEEIWKLPSYMASSLCLSNFSNLKGLILRSLNNTIIKFNKCFKHDLEKGHISAEKIREYKILWLHWSHLVSKEYYMLGLTYSYAMLLMLFTVITTLYACLVEFHHIQLDWMRIMNMGIPCATCIFTLYSVCNAAHHLQILGEQIKDELQLILPINVSFQVMQEVKSFLTAIEMNPPVISVMGFVNVDRGLFRALISTTVTYMIVLIQFDKGNSTKKCKDVP